MGTKIRRQRLMIPVAPAVAGMVGAFAIIATALMPNDVFESAVVESGLPAILGAAEPPLGVTARLVLVMVLGGGAALLSWFGLFLLIGTRAIAFAQGAMKEGSGALPALRRADAHPDAPARAPLLANRDLGTPFLDISAAAVPSLMLAADGDDIATLLPQAAAAANAAPAAGVDTEIAALAALHALAPTDEEWSLPANLDTPMAHYGPQLLHQQPAASPPEDRQAPRRAASLAPGERMETFELTPMVRAACLPPAAQQPQPGAVAGSIGALLERLERGVTHKAERALAGRRTEDGVQQAFAALRRAASGN